MNAFVVRQPQGEAELKAIREMRHLTYSAMGCYTEAFKQKLLAEPLEEASGQCLTLVAVDEANQTVLATVRGVLSDKLEGVVPPQIAPRLASCLPVAASRFLLIERMCVQRQVHPAISTYLVKGVWSWGLALGAEWTVGLSVQALARRYVSLFCADSVDEPFEVPQDLTVPVFFTYVKNSVFLERVKSKPQAEIFLGDTPNIVVPGV